MRKFPVGLLYTLLSAIIIIGGSALAISYARGNFRVTRQGFIPQTGLLSANSFPPGAEIYIDDRLASATDDTLYLEPGEYNVEIIKDGYWPWQKTLQIEQELVTQTNAQLFPIAPSLTPLTFTGVDRVAPSPDGQKMLYITSTGNNPEQNGIYILELTNNLLSLQRSAQQIAELPDTFSLEEAHIIWSPDSAEVMILAPEKEVVVTTNRMQNLDTLPDISFRRRQILSEWEEEMYIRERQFLSEFPDEVITIATQSARNTYISPDKKRLLYTASASATLPPDLIPPIPAANTQPESRDISENQVYIYDREEDRNFFIGEQQPDNTPYKVMLADDLYNRSPLTLEASPSAFQSLQATSSAQTAELFNRYHTALYLDSFQWFPDSKHVLYTQNNGIQIKSYDNTNDTTVYSGPFEDSFVYPWPDGSKLMVLTRFNPESPLNLYAIELK